jgi:hypothetical protein
MTKRRDIFIRNARINKGKENRGYYENFSEEIDNQREMMEKERESVLEEFEQREAEEGIWRDSEINEETILESSEN